MSFMNDVHRQAMDFAGLGLIERQRGNPNEAIGYFQRALEYELKALAELTEPVEPTHSVLHRSAATLAMDCGDDRLAEKLAAKALAEEPPWEIAEELRDVLEQVYARRRVGSEKEAALLDEGDEFGGDDQ